MPGLPWIRLRDFRLTPKTLLFGIYICTACGLVFIIVFARKILAVLSAFSDFAHQHTLLGFALCVCMLFVTAFPPLFGYSTMLCLCGFIYGFPWGVVPAITGAMSGAYSCYYLSSKYFSGAASRMVRESATFSALQHVIRQRGFKLVLIIRLAPYPFNYGNVFFAGIELPRDQFLLSTLLSVSLKSAIEVLIGSQIKEIEAILHGDQNSRPWATVILISGILLGLWLSAWLWFSVRRVIADEEAARVLAEPAQSQEHALSDDISSTSLVVGNQL